MNKRYGIFGKTNPLILSTFSILLMGQAAIGQPIHDKATGNAGDPQLEKVVCGGPPNSLCLSPIDDLTMVLYGCAEGSQVIGVPSNMINVPPGQNLKFSVLVNPDSLFRTFSIVTEAVTNGMGGNPCVGGVGIFTGPIAIDDTTNPNPTIYEIPSAVIDQIVAEVTNTGFVVGIAANCNGSAQLFSGMGFTRNPNPSGADLALSQTSAPSVVLSGEPFSVDLSLENTSLNTAVSPSLSFPLPIGVSMLSGNLGGNPCTVSNGLVTCNTSDLPAGAQLTASFTFLAELFGKARFEINAIAETCDDNISNNLLTVTPFINVPPSQHPQFGLGTNGNGTRTDFWVQNLGSSPAQMTLFAMDNQCSPSSLPFPGADFLEIDLQPGETYQYQTQEDANIPSPYVWFLKTDSGNTEDLIANFRPTQFIPSGGGDLFLGSTEPMIPLDDLALLASPFPIPIFDIVTGTGINTHIVNLNDTTQNVTSKVRDQDTGLVSGEFMMTLAPYEIQTMPLIQLGLPGTNNNSLWFETVPGVYAMVESGFDTGTFLETFSPFLLSPGDLENLRQPLFRPDPMNMDFDPSELDQFRQSPTGAATGSFTTILDYYGDCDSTTIGVQLGVFPSIPILGGASQSIAIDDQEDIGGFIDSNPGETTSTVRWREGNSQLWVKASKPSDDWIVQVPKIEGNGGPANRPANVRHFFNAEMPTKVAVAAYYSNGDLFGAYTVELPAGGSELCIDQDMDDVDYLEFHHMPGGNGLLWYDGFAIDAKSEYKDDLPKHAVGKSRVGEFHKILEAWNGSGPPDCPSDEVDILDIVNFMNNGLKCP